MVVDLADLQTVKPAVESFLAREHRLDVLVHNAAVMSPPSGSKDKLVWSWNSRLLAVLTWAIQGHDLELGANCLAPYLMTLLLEPILMRTAKTTGTPKGSVRIVWVTSMLLEGELPKEGMTFQSDGTPVILSGFMDNYMQSKIGDAWLADNFAKRLGEHGILSVVSRILESKSLNDRTALMNNRVFTQG
jgi:retinol dehydrogenase-12